MLGPRFGVTPSFGDIVTDIGPQWTCGQYSSRSLRCEQTTVRIHNSKAVGRCARVADPKLSQVGLAPSLGTCLILTMVPCFVTGSFNALSRSHEPLLYVAQHVASCATLRSYYRPEAVISGAVYGP